MHPASHPRPHIRQGDVLLVPVDLLPPGCTEVPQDKGCIVLAHGEVTGHAHAIYDHAVDLADQHGGNPVAATEIADTAIARARVKARLWRAPDGERYLEVSMPVTLRHEEHTAHTIPHGIYKLPRQVEYAPQDLRGDTLQELRGVMD